MDPQHREPRAEHGGSGAPEWLSAGVVGRPHGLDGSFYVVRPSAALLLTGVRVRLHGVERVIERRAGTDARPIVRLGGIGDRAGAERVRGVELLVERGQAPDLEEDEWWSEDLEGCVVHDGERSVGTVRRVLALPSCEVLEVERDGDTLLVPLVTDAVRSVDIDAKRIDVDLAFLGEE